MRALSGTPLIGALGWHGSVVARFWRRRSSATSRVGKAHRQRPVHVPDHAFKNSFAEARDRALVWSVILEDGAEVGVIWLERSAQSEKAVLGILLADTQHFGRGIGGEAIKKLSPYKGLLSSAEVAAGMNAAIRNANRLAEDARILLNAGRIPTAASLAALAIEEAGKISVLRQVALAASQKDAAKAWKPYRRHTGKNFMWLLPQVVADGARQLEDFRSLVTPDAEHPQLLDQFKQLGFYTDTYKRGQWSCPDDVIDQVLAESLVGVAELLASNKTVTAEEIDLWVKHLGPVWGNNNEWMQQALVNWYAEMQECGLAPPGANAMQAFVRLREEQ